jgi:hypothetical protein
MKLLKCLVHVDDAYVEKSVEIPSMKDTQGTVTHNRDKRIVEYEGKVEGTLFFKEVKPTEKEKWLL